MSYAMVLFLAAALEFAGRALALRLGAGWTLNSGVSFGLLRENPPLALFLSGLALAALLACLFSIKGLSGRARLGLAAGVGGAAANFLQRLLGDGVVDWIPLPLSGAFFEGGLRFNLADVEILLGLAAAFWEGSRPPFLTNSSLPTVEELGKIQGTKPEEADPCA